MAIAAKALVLQLANGKVSDDGVVELLPMMIGACLPGLGATPLLLIARTVPGSVDEGPVVASVGCTRVNSDASKLVLEAIFSFWLDMLILIAFSFASWLLSLRLFILLFALFLLREPVLLAHDFVVGVRSEVEVLRELVVLVHLVVLERVEVEDDSLQMHDQHVGRLRDQGPLADIYFLLAA